MLTALFVLAWLLTPIGRDGGLALLALGIILIRTRLAWAAFRS
jgi:hypothetical protein